MLELALAALKSVAEKLNNKRKADLNLVYFVILGVVDKFSVLCCVLVVVIVVVVVVVSVVSVVVVVVVVVNSTGHHYLSCVV